jgi:hypothetical protein
MRRKDVEAALAAHYSKKFRGKVWCIFDTSKRAYCIRGENLPAARKLRKVYPNGWSLLDYINPTKARQLIKI